jgi:hypothetical protein
MFKVFFLSDQPKKESLFVTGFVPMTQCEFTIELEKPEKKGFVIVQTPGGKIVITRKSSGEYSVESYFRDVSENLASERMMIPANGGKITLKIKFDGITRTNTISGNDQNPVCTPFYSPSRSQLKYPSFSTGYIKISTIALPDQGASTAVLYSVSQSAPRKLVTPLGDKSCQPFGFDGPHAFSTIKNGLAYMKKSGDRGTIWFDILYLLDKEYTAFLASFIRDECWEAGIHYSKSLETLPSPEAFQLLSDEYDQISSLLDTPPESWCSLRNGDNVHFANYASDTFNMVWRNGDCGVHAEQNVGGLDDESWEWWNLASAAGMIHPVFVHQTDRDPAQRYSLSYSHFTTWIDNYHANGISIVPFYEWWRVNANTHEMEITGISIQNHRLRFRVKTNGERGLVNVNISPVRDLIINDIKTNEIIPWTDLNGNSVTFYVQSDHEYGIGKKTQKK